MRAACVLAVMILATACGQTGSLYLPDQDVESPVEIRTPEAPAPPPPQATVPPAEPKEAEKKNDEPPDR
jgi:predicted small lipoprotein YifL